MARPKLLRPPSVPRSRIAVPSHRKACRLPPAVVLAMPATCPESLMATPSLDDPPSVPRSRIAVPSHRKA